MSITTTKRREGDLSGISAPVSEVANHPWFLQDDLTWKHIKSRCTPHSRWSGRWPQRLRANDDGENLDHGEDDPDPRHSFKKLLEDRLDG